MHDSLLKCGECLRIELHRSIQSGTSHRTNHAVLAQQGDPTPLGPVFVGRRSWLLRINILKVSGDLFYSLWQLLRFHPAVLLGQLLAAFFPRKQCLAKFGIRLLTPYTYVRPKTAAA